MKTLTEVVHGSTFSQAIVDDPIRIFSQTRVIKWQRPFFSLFWQQPTASLVEQNGQTRRMPIWDITRIVQLRLLGLGFLGVVGAFISMWRRIQSA